MNDLSAIDVQARVRSVIANVLNVRESLLLPESRIVEDLGADSLDKISLLMMLEDEFGSSISDEDALTLTSVSAVEKYILNRLNLVNL